MSTLTREPNAEPHSREERRREKEIERLLRESRLRADQLEMVMSDIGDPPVIAMAGESPWHRKCGSTVVFNNQRQWLADEGIVSYLVNPEYPDIAPREGDIYLPSMWSPTEPGEERYRNTCLSTVMGVNVEPIRRYWPRGLRLPGMDAGFFSLYHLEGELAKRHVNVTHGHGPDFAAENVAFAARRRDIAFILQVHTDQIRFLKGRRKECPPHATAALKRQIWRFNRGIDLALLDQPRRARRLADMADVVMAPSEDCAKFFRQDTGFGGDIMLFPSHIEPVVLMDDQEKAIFDAEFRYRWGIRDDSDIILDPGRVSMEKNAHFLIPSFALLLQGMDRNPIPGRSKPTLVFAGPAIKEYELSMLNEARELGILNHIRFIGGQTKPQMLRVMQIAKYIAKPTTGDTQCLVIIEAEACKKPTIVMRDEAPAEFVPNCPVLKSPPIHECWADCMRQLLTHQRLYEEMADKCYKIGLSYSDPKIYVAHLTYIYRYARAVHILRRKAA